MAWSHFPPLSDGAIEIWENGVIREVTDWGLGPHLNDAGQLAFSRWHAAIGEWHQWLLRDGEFINVSEDGYMLIKKGYAWDGPSGPVLDRRSTMRAALVHDALYQLMRHGHLDVFQWREPADALFRDMCREDGVYGWLAAIYYYAVRRFGKVAASSRSVKRKLRAP